MTDAVAVALAARHRTMLMPPLWRCRLVAGHRHRMHGMMHPGRRRTRPGRCRALRHPAPVHVTGSEGIGGEYDRQEEAE